MKKWKLIRNIADVFFWGFGAGMVFSGIMILLSNRPIRSAGCMLICIGLALAFANLEVWAEGRMRLLREREKATRAERWNAA